MIEGEITFNIILLDVMAFYAMITEINFFNKQISTVPATTKNNKDFYGVVIHEADNNRESEKYGRESLGRLNKNK